MIDGSIGGINGMGYKSMDGKRVIGAMDFSWVCGRLWYGMMHWLQDT